MKINGDNLVSISTANKNFSKIARLADKKGSAVILKNNKIKYIVLPYKEVKKEEIFPDENIEDLAQRLIEKIKDEYNIQLKLDIENN
ncbi:MULTISPECIES: prevent-host-death protein [Anaerococcus]|uniref:Prevent-host-death family protein n=3 Tax=Anaerococcus TaxID=165779 RepID=C7HVP2_9FIRM|nr:MULTISPECIES: prevent-host-death protein [Anaerococcus]EEU12182.1 prevent-host-death family protein [Anaerococcus vaginalis ATCC 51170]MBS4889793.1 type II toxin-antitoxin system Phd/YefM family antitoxin [Anaerococcus vaginalis]MBS6921223.1 type II toxin-antitoxin system Phd/YefM family antitoxin [Anaerococcus vaginalis]MDD7766742.1 type II toxin-antitoxin system Phd/YefM family antitoxin [Anaerococcus vaginalis]MDU0945350.1 type II toxin-antitoxin system Phd/YefM family antitoxin [Anaeroc